MLSYSDIDVYESWIEQKTQSYAKGRPDGTHRALHSKIQRDIEHLPDGMSALMWIGNRRTAKRVILYLHGGGFVVPVSTAHLETSLRIVEAFSGSPSSPTSKETAVAILDYSPCPPAQYPTQFRQTVDALRHLLQPGRWKPSQVVIGGDSVGGLLTAQVLFHIVHRHPSIEPLHLTEPFAAVFMLSPWVSQDTTSASFIRNQYIDTLTARSVRSAAANVFSGPLAEKDLLHRRGWISPLDAPQGWLKDWSKVTRHCYVAWGAKEVLASQCKEFARTLVQQCGEEAHIRLDEGVNEGHGWAVFEGFRKEKGRAMGRLLDWLSTTFAED